MTVQELVNGALRVIGVLDATESPSTSESNHAFEALNDLLSSWSAETGPIYKLSLDTVAMTGAASYALASRPVKIHAASVTNGGVSFDAEVVDAKGFSKAKQFDSAATSNFAEVLWFDGGYPTGNVHLFPIVNNGSTLNLYSYKPMTAFASLAATLDLPPGHVRALRLGLALDLAPEYGRPTDALTVKQAADAKAALLVTNAQVTGNMPPAATVAPTASKAA
jgi:hypothetical protein